MFRKKGRKKKIHSPYIHQVDNSYKALLKAPEQDRRQSTRTNPDQWMKKEFDKVDSTFLDQTDRAKYKFCTGSTYEGKWDGFGMAGPGVYKLFTHEIFEGRMKDSEFHGVGKFKWPCGSFMETLFVEGALANYDTYRYADGKLYTTSYCEMPDRRFNIELETGIRPAGRSFLTDNEAPRTIPDGCYDAGDGFYNPITKCVYNYNDDKEVLRIPKKSEHEWILKHCRKAWDEVAGYRPEFYENWFSQDQYDYGKALFGVASEEDLQSRFSTVRQSYQLDPINILNMNNLV